MRGDEKGGIIHSHVMFWEKGSKNQMTHDQSLLFLLIIFFVLVTLSIRRHNNGSYEMGLTDYKVCMQEVQKYNNISDSSLPIIFTALP